MGQDTFRASERKSWQASCLHSGRRCVKWEGSEAEALGQGLREDIPRVTVCSGLGHLDALCPQSCGLGGARELLTGVPPRGLGFLLAWWLVLWGPVSVEVVWPCGHSLGRHPSTLGGSSSGSRGGGRTHSPWSGQTPH